MLNIYQKILLVFDDRELVSGEVRSFVGARHFGDIIFKCQTIKDYFYAALPKWANERLIHMRTTEDIIILRSRLESSDDDCAICVISSCAGFMNPGHLNQFIERLLYAEEDFTDKLYKPLIVFMRNAHKLVKQWSIFEKEPLHFWKQAWQDSQRLQSVRPLNLSKIQDFLCFTSGSTATRHFNKIEADEYYYTKSSSDKHKMLAEYSFYNFVPESMRSWLVQPFNYKEESDRSSYKMLRYYLADAALQWIHGAFDEDTFTAFIKRILFFITERPCRSCDRTKIAKVARNLFVLKPEERIRQFLTLDDGKKINKLACSSMPELDIKVQLERYLGLYNRYEEKFIFNNLVVGHGDPCFSNILYDQQRHILKLIDPKGVVSEEEIWTHPLYDICKISHSVLGDYDFINNGLYDMGFTDNNELFLHLSYSNQGKLKSIWLQKIKNIGYDIRIVRLAEASLFISMLPLHIDHPKKIMAFLLKIKQILDEVEDE